MFEKDGPPFPRGLLQHPSFFVERIERSDVVGHHPYERHVGRCRQQVGGEKQRLVGVADFEQLLVAGSVGALTWAETFV